MIKVYDLTYFELHSKTRNRNFRFCRYDGNNYTELHNYITALSSQTKIWDKTALKKGKYYTFSGRYFTMQEVHEWELRACIASNPYIVLEDGLHPLAQSRNEVIEYLKQGAQNRVFPYESLVDSFGYDPTTKNFILFNVKHPKGLSIETLPNYSEWYIGKDDSLHLLFENIEAKYTVSAHMVTFDFGLREKADQIIDLIYDINKNAFYGKNKQCIFKPSWEDAKRYKTLYTPCLKEYSFKEFVFVLYNYVFEETKSKDVSGKSVTRELLPEKFKHDEFVNHVNELRNHYTHGVAEYQSAFEPIYEIFKFYIEMPLPRSETDYETLQTKLLDGFINFLTRLKDFYIQTSIVEGNICLDDNNNVYCGNVLLPRELSVWGGAKCVIKSKEKNNLSPLNRTYPFFSQFPQLFIDFKGVISETHEDDAQFYFCDEIYLGGNLSTFVGCVVIVKSITILSQSDVLYSQFKYKASEMEVVIQPHNNIIDYSDLRYMSDKLMIDEIKRAIETVELSNIRTFYFKNIKGSLKIVAVQLDKDCVHTPYGKIEQDSKGIYHIGNVMLDTRFAQYHKGRICEIIDVVLSDRDPNYPYFSYKVKFVK